MDEENSVKKQVQKVVTKFINDCIRATPKSVIVDIHPNSVVATLQGIVPPVERDYAKAEQACELLEKFYGNIFNVRKKVLENIVGDVLGKVINSSMLRVDPASGNAVIMFTLAD